MPPLNVVIFSYGAGKQQYGLGQDARLLELTLREMNATGKTNINISHADPYAFVGTEWPKASDVHIYLEIPCRVAFSWAKVNIIIPNAEWWYTDAWSWTKDAGALFWFRTLHSQRLFLESGIKGSYIGWRCPTNTGTGGAAVKRALYVVGGSKHKKTAADVVVAAWKDSWPPLTVLCSSEAPAVMGPNVDWRRKYVSNEEKRQLQDESLYHVVASEAEGFGYTMAEALQRNALILRTDIPVYEELWGTVLGPQGRIETTKRIDISGASMMDQPRMFSTDAVVNAMNDLLAMSPRKYNADIVKLNKNFRETMAIAWKYVENRVSKNPPLLLPVPVASTDLPVIGVITLVHNRPQWFSHAVRNIETSTYPRAKLIWVVVDDSDGNGRVDRQIEAAKAGLPDIQIQYVSLNKKTPIGDKRNRGCVAAAAMRPDVSVFAFMDDDDHYPKSSLDLRVAWLKASKKKCVYSSTLPMYDVCKYISAINVPPLNLLPCERVSEATLCFERSFWEERHFPNTVSVAEGEDFLKGRDTQTAEIPPGGVIVSFLHGKNFTSRRVPEQKEPNGCHYGFSDTYFTMISEIASVANA
jgi:hypothetical protein